MFKKLVFSTSVVSFSLLLLAGCSRRLVDFTVISSKNVPITENGIGFKKATSRVQGIDKKWSILFVPGIPDMKEAIDDAIEKYPGAVALTDGVIYSKAWSCFLFGQNKYVVEGTPLYPELEKNATTGASQYSSNNNKPQLEEPAQPVQPVTNVMRITHSVENGETLVSIAAAYKVSMLDIMKWNDMTSNTVTRGMKLVIYIEK